MTGFERYTKETRRALFLEKMKRYSWERAHRALAYYPRFNVKAGVAQTVAWYRLRGWI